jgi:hypothetical protein
MSIMYNCELSHTLINFPLFYKDIDKRGEGGENRVSCGIKVTSHPMVE